MLPDNLVPSCRDCNLGDKKSDYATTAAEQIIHPFLDADHFFNEQWIFAQYHPAKNGSPSRVDYHPSPPTGWSQQDKKRVQKDFLILISEEKTGYRPLLSWLGLSLRFKR